MPDFRSFLPPASAIEQLVSIAIAEDVGSGDLTASLIPSESVSVGRLLCREDAVLCGTRWVEETCRQIDPAIAVTWHFNDGERMPTDSLVCVFSGRSRSILTAERTAINLLQTLSGVATAAAAYVDAVAGTGTRILDTRKTIPGMRLAQKYAVRCGGAHNHRIGLYDGVLIKENHIAAAGSIHAAVEAARAAAPDCELMEVEVESLDELDQALDAGATRIMLDNFDLGMMREGVSRASGRAEIEASGNVTLSGLREIAETGVDYISIGALTKHIRATDFSLRFEA